MKLVEAGCNSLTLFKSNRWLQQTNDGAVTDQSPVSGSPLPVPTAQ